MTQSEQGLENRLSVERATEDLIRYAECLGLVVTIKQESLLPLAIGNYETIFSVRPARHESGYDTTAVEEEPRVQTMPMVERLLRKLLAHQVAGTRGYYDDGELQDNNEVPSIDFLRDHPNDIEMKLFRRGNKRPRTLQG